MADTTWTFWEIAEADLAVQNPIDDPKVLRIGEIAGLQPAHRVLDMGCGKGGPALLLSQAFGCHVDGVDRSAFFIGRARERFEAAGLSRRATFYVNEAMSFDIEAGAYDVAMCLGATFIFDGLVPTLERLQKATRCGGIVAVGECFWKRWPLPPGYHGEAEHHPETFVTLPDTVRRIERAGLRLLDMLIASDDERDRYETAHWRALERWLHENPQHPQAERFAHIHRVMKDDYLRYERDVLGWGIFIARREP